MNTPQVGETCRLWLNGHPLNRKQVTVIQIVGTEITCVEFSALANGLRTKRGSRKRSLQPFTCTAANLAPLKTPFTPYAS